MLVFLQETDLINPFVAMCNLLEFSGSVVSGEKKEERTTRQFTCMVYQFAFQFFKNDGQLEFLIHLSQMSWDPFVKVRLLFLGKNIHIGSRHSNCRTNDFCNEA